MVAALGGVQLVEYVNQLLSFGTLNLKKDKMPLC